MTAAQNERRDWLAEARERAGRSQDSLGDLLGVTGKTVSHWERGVSIPRPDVRAELAKALGFTMDELCRRLGLTSAPEQASLNGDGPGVFGAITGWLSMIVRAEQSAYAIWTLAVTALPALCQTPGYAHTLESGGHRDFPPHEVDEMVRARLERAAVLDRATYTALIAAPLLEACAGGPDVMAEQLAHLLDLADQPNVTLQVLDVEHLYATPGEFSLLATAGTEPDTAVEIGVRGPIYAEGPVATLDHAALFAHLASLARDPEASRVAIARAADRFAAMATTATKRGTR